MTTSRTRWVIACAAGILLAGCDDGPPADASAAPKAPTKAPKPVSQLPPDMVSAVASSRNAHVVTVHFLLKGTPTVMKPLPVDIAIVPHEPVLGLTAHFEARDGMALTTGHDLARQADPQPESVIKHQLVLLPDKEGVFMVTALVETESSGGIVTRLFSIPVIVGAPGEAAAAPPPPPPPPKPASG